MSGVYLDDDGVVRLEALVERLLDGLAEPPVCSWCASEVVRTSLGGRLSWAHRDTGLLVCSGQVIGGWAPLREAAPAQWRVAVRPRRARRNGSAVARTTEKVRGDVML